MNEVLPKSRKPPLARGVLRHEAQDFRVNVEYREELDPVAHELDHGVEILLAGVVRDQAALPKRGHCRFRRCSQQVTLQCLYVGCCNLQFAICNPRFPTPGQPVTDAGAVSPPFRHVARAAGRQAGRRQQGVIGAGKRRDQVAVGGEQWPGCLERRLQHATMPVPIETAAAQKRAQRVGRGQLHDGDRDRRARPARHRRGARDDDPVLGAVMVALQREGRTRMHCDPFDLKPRPDDEAFEPAPGPVIAGRLHRLLCTLRLQRGDRLLDALRLGLVGDEDGVRLTGEWFGFVDQRRPFQASLYKDATEVDVLPGS